MRQPDKEEGQVRGSVLQSLHNEDLPSDAVPKFGGQSGREVPGLSQSLQVPDLSERPDESPEAEAARESAWQTAAAALS